MTDKKLTACFTGHRKISKQDVEKISNSLERIIEQLYQKGVIYYCAGGALGFDTLAEREVLRARERHSEIKLILILPCRDQDKGWSAANKAAYAEILKSSDQTVYVSPSYYRGCMQARNRRLVDSSGYCIAYLVRDSGGTAYTVNYARKKGLQIINTYDIGS